MFAKEIKCPVCDTVLGEKVRGKGIQVFHCDECRAKVTLSSEGKFHMTLDRDIEKGKCGCGTCRR